MKTLKSSAGFTLMEVLIVIVIVSLMALIGGPSLLAWFPNLHFRNASQNLFLDLQFTKTTAIKRNANVSIAFDDVACGGGIPDDGGRYEIFIDDDTDGVRDPGEDLLRAVEIPDDVAICDSADDFTGDFLTFLPTGIPDGGKFGTAEIQNINARKSFLNVNLAGGISIKTE
jgi:type IV fimbrial biogenesis protein FimT